MVSTVTNWTSRNTNQWGYNHGTALCFYDITCGAYNCYTNTISEITIKRQSFEEQTVQTARMTRIWNLFLHIHKFTTCLLKILLSLSESWIICTWRLHLPPRAADHRSANKQRRMNFICSSHKPFTIQMSRVWNVLQQSCLLCARNVRMFRMFLTGHWKDVNTVCVSIYLFTY